MKFLVDAHLPRALARLLQSYGHTVVHTLDLPDQNRTKDPVILHYATTNDCIVTTKDADFIDAFYIQDMPRQLWLISTGNINNRDLEHLVRANIQQIILLFQTHRFLELTRTELIIHV
jgi:predicted nuclease of predicted toxin-antitoxin system